MSSRPAWAIRLCIKKKTLNKFFKIGYKQPKYAIKGRNYEGKSSI
jgi:hypothetical protein